MPRPPNSFGAAIPMHAELGQAVDHRARDIGLAVDRRGVDMLVRERPHRRHRFLDHRPLALR